MKNLSVVTDRLTAIHARLPICYLVKDGGGKAVEEEAEAELVGDAARRVLVVVLVHELVAMGAA